MGSFIQASNPHAEAPDMPPSMDRIVANAAKTAALEQAEEMAHRAMWRKVLRWVPRPLHPLIPGYSEESAWVTYKRWASKYFWGLVSSAILSLVIFGSLAIFLLGLAGYIVYLVMIS